MDLKNLIIKRKSIRNFDLTPLDTQMLQKVREVLLKAKPLNNEKYMIRIIDKKTFDSSTKGRFKVKAPHYLMFYGNVNDDSYKNIGYVGELIVLALTDLDLGTCWLGGATTINKEDEHDYIIAIAFGKPDESFRIAATDFKRKPLDDIAGGDTHRFAELLAQARLAPSAMNFQPWYFKCVGHKIHVFRKKYLLKLAHLESMQKVDIGIAVSHFATSAFTWKKESAVLLKNYIYEGTIVL